ncbi:MAG: phosphonate ABC transporter, permease protein PhnE [Candidatus Bipolaricaulota bacterium]|nr:phosphonate ABC transporter, permease protein PhnE [Candidatus Bipolaricaulota bacterium]
MKEWLFLVRRRFRSWATSLLTWLHGAYVAFSQWVRLVRPRLISFLFDWIAWVYLLYAGFSVHHIRTSPTLIWRPEEKFVLPELSPTGWIVVLLVTIELALFVRSFGVSLGQRAFGVSLAPAGGSGTRVAFPRRVLHFLASHLALASLGLPVLVNPERPWHERVAGVVLVPRARGASRYRPWWTSAYALTAAVLIGVTVALGWAVTDIQLGALVRDVGKPARLWRGLSRPDLSYFFTPHPMETDSIFGALVKSLFMALLATVLGAAIAFPLSFLGARNITATGPVGRLVYALTRGFFNVFRSIESIFWASIFAIWVGFGAFAGTIALFLHTIAALGKLYSEQVEHIDPGPVEAATAAGGNRLQVIKQAVIPQVLPPFLAFTLYRWDINLRMATVVGFVGGGGIGLLLKNFKDGGEWTQVGAVIVTFAVTVWLLDFVSGWVRERIV